MVAVLCLLALAWVTPLSVVYYVGVAVVALPWSTNSRSSA
jgi:hypothetical protein